MRFPTSGFIALASLFAMCTTASSSGIPLDSLIIGGGFSGLYAAKTLTAAGKSYVVLEARNRTGGRVENGQLAVGGYTEVGGEFFGPTQDYALALAKEFNVPLFEAYNKGKNVYYFNGKRALASSTSIFGQAIPNIDLISLAQILAAQSSINDMASKINVQTPWNTSAKTTAWDQQTFGAWLDARGLTKTARAVLDTATTSLFSVTPENVSLLFAISYIAAAGDAKNKGTFDRITSTAGGGQNFRVVGGTQILATKLADELGSEHIVLNSAVQSVIKGQDGTYSVKTREGKTYSAKHIIVAMSPPVAAKIEFSPALSDDRVQLQQRTKMGNIGKAIATYKEPFWRKSGLSGQAISGSGTVRATFDQSLHDGSVYGLMGFIEADEMKQLDGASDQQIIELVTKDFVNYFGSQAANATSWLIKRWDSEEFSLGGPTALFQQTGVFSKYGPALRAPVGNVHFAGTESSDYWTGYIDGALRAGERAAKEVIAA
ncbi:hypothetical protein OC846_006737, partial [Tilletia horrida]